MWKILKEYIWNNKASMFFLLIIQIIITLLSIVIPYLNGSFLDLISVSKDLNALFNFIFIFGSIGILSVVISFVGRLSKLKIKTKISYALNLKLIKHLELIGIQEFNKYDTAYLNQRINLDSNNVVEFFIENCIIFFLFFLQLAVILIVICKFNLIILFLVLIFIFIYILFYNLLKKNIFKYNSVFKESQSNFFSLLNKTIFMNREIRTHSLYNESGKVLNNGFDKYFKNTMKYGWASSYFSSCEGIISLIFQIAILVIGGILIMKNKISLGEYSVINIYFNMIISIIKYYFNIGKGYQEVGVSVNRIMQILNIEEEDNGIETIEKIDIINVNDLTFNYSENSTVINQLSYEFTKDNIYIIQGENGTGKSTLLSILIRLRSDLKNGNVSFNNCNIETLDMYKIRKNNISVYLQNEEVQDVTIREYLFDGKEFNDESVQSLISSMNLDKFLINDSFNILTLLNRSIENLSTGEKQKILIFRTFLKKADVYILDEPTSNIDNESKKHLLDFISLIKKDKIIILITHDKEVKDIADKTIDMNLNSHF